jgi:protein-disulfide isomerase
MKRYRLLGMSAVAFLGMMVWLIGAATATDDAMTKTLVEYFRRKANIPPNTQVEVKDLQPSKIKGAKSGTLSVGGRPMAFTVSDDGRYAFFGELEDLTVDPFAAVMKKISLKDVATKGPANAKVTIVEYSDFQCPFCSKGYQVIESQVLKDYGDKIRFAYKNFPLPMHPWAEPAAIASRCAEQQKPAGFWKLYDYYFQNQKDITAQNLKDKSLEALKGSGVDATKFGDCLDNKKTLDAVKAEQAEGTSVGVNGTPAFIINGRLISGAQPYESFKAIIDDELARAGKK